MYFVMIQHGHNTWRHGRMFKNLEPAIRLAMRSTGAYVEKYGMGVVWTPKLH
jgi:hypothetical protein